MNGDDTRMAELGGAAGLAQEAVEVLRPREVAGARQFDRHGAVQLRVAGSVHRTEGAVPDDLDQLKAADPPVGWRRGCGGIDLQAEARSAGGADDLFPSRDLHDLDR